MPKSMKRSCPCTSVEVEHSHQPSYGQVLLAAMVGTTTSSSACQIHAATVSCSEVEQSLLPAVIPSVTSNSRALPTLPSTTFGSLARSGNGAGGTGKVPVWPNGPLSGVVAPDVPSNF